MNRFPAVEGVWAAALIVGCASALSGCGSGGGAATRFVDTHPLPVDTLTFAVDSIGSYGGRFVIGETTPPKTFNGMIASETSSIDITSSRLFTGLTDFDNLEQRDTPGFAKSWEMAPDRVTWTFHLRRGTAFSDGHPMSSADVLFSFAVAFDSIVHPPIQDLMIQNGKRWEVSAPDSYTFVIRTPAPNALVPSIAGSVSIMPKHILEGAFRAGTFQSAYNVSTPPNKIVTSGPWRVQRYVANEKTVLTRNPYWYGVDPAGHRLPYLNELVFLVVPDQDALDLKFRSREVDGIDNPKPENYRWYADHQQEGDFTLYNLGPALKTNYFLFNLNRVRKPVKGKTLGGTYVDSLKYAWFSNPVFRRAVSMAINRDAMISSVFFGDGVKNWSTMTAGNKVWYDSSLVRFDYDPARAKKLLASLGFKDRDGDGFLEDAHGHPLAFTIKTNSDNRLRVAMGNFITDDLAKVGIKVKLVPMDFNTLTTNLHKDFDYETVILGSDSAIPPDPGMGGNVWRSSGSSHLWNVKQPKPETPQEARIDQLMDAVVSTPEMSKRKAAWREVANTINDQCWIEWLPTIVLKLPVRNGFGNLQPTAIPHRLLWNIDRVYVKVRAQPA